MWPRSKKARATSMGAVPSSFLGCVAAASILLGYGPGLPPRALAADEATPDYASATLTEATVTLSVSNLPSRLCCAAVAGAISSSIREVLATVPGFLASRVSFGDKTVIVSFDPAVTDVAALAAALRTKGYRVEVPSS